MNHLEKINRQVAKALGWTKFAYENFTHYKEKNLKFLNKPRLTGLAPGNQRKQCVPNYAINLAYAWKCVDFAKERGIIFDIDVNPISKEIKARFIENMDKRGVAFHEKPSMAICLAFINLRKS